MAFEQGSMKKGMESILNEVRLLRNEVSKDIRHIERNKWQEKTLFMCQDGIVMVYLLSGKLKKNIEKKDKTKMMFLLFSSVKSAESLLKNG